MTDQQTSKEVIHRVCQWIKDDQTARGYNKYPKCEGCELVTQTPYGPGVQACVMQAQELIALLQQTPELPDEDHAAQLPVPAPKFNVGDRVWLNFGHPHIDDNGDFRVRRRVETYYLSYNGKDLPAHYEEHELKPYSDSTKGKGE